MDVYAVRLREKGRKLPRAAVSLAVPIHCKLTLSRTRARRTHEPCVGAWLTKLDDPSTFVFPSMRPAEVVVISGAQLLIVGVEFVGDRGYSHEWPQAWWCRLNDPALGGKGGHSLPVDRYFAKGLP